MTREEIINEIEDLESTIEELMDEYDKIDSCKRDPRWLEEACNIFGKKFEFEYVTDDIIVDQVRQKASEWDWRWIVRDLEGLDDSLNWYVIDWYGNYQNPNWEIEDEFNEMLTSIVNDVEYEKSKLHSFQEELSKLKD